jgi:hypothetical protein
LPAPAGLILAFLAAALASGCSHVDVLPCRRARSRLLAEADYMYEINGSRQQIKEGKIFASEKLLIYTRLVSRRSFP